VKEIVLTTINAKWIHPSLALRLLKANLGLLEDSCEIIEFALRQPLSEKTEPILARRPRILGISVSIWNHTAVLQMLEELAKTWAARTDTFQQESALNERSETANVKPVVVLGGPEVSHLPAEAEIFKYADYVIRGEGETAFRKLCENILTGGQEQARTAQPPQFIDAENVPLDGIKSAYHLYTEEDLAKKLIYVEASRGCPFNCEFCLSAADGSDRKRTVREFPLESFLAEMDKLICNGVKTFKFLDRTFNFNIERAVKICEFFLEKTEKRKGITVHFEMVPSLFPQELTGVLARFPPDTLRLEIGIQSLNAEVSSRIGRPSNPEKELETLRLLREKTHAIIHADLIAGLPGENLESFGKGFDRLWLALSCPNKRNEIQLGILKLLPGAKISRHNENFGMKYNSVPPYEIEETSAMSAAELQRIKRFARFWEMIVNRRLIELKETKPVFEKFMNLSNSLFDHFGRSWGIDKRELLEVVKSKINAD